MTTVSKRAFIQVGEEDTLYEKMATYKTEADELQIPLYFLPYAEILPETNKSWCPDCVAADKYIDALLQNVGGYLVTSYIRRDGYREHIYRSDPKIKLTSVPTLFKWGSDGPTDRLVERDVCDYDKLAQFAGVPVDQLTKSS